MNNKFSTLPAQEINLEIARIERPEIDWYVESGECRGMPRDWHEKVSSGIG